MIFYVEDDDNIRELMLYTLKASGFSGKGFPNAAEFWQALSKTQDVLYPDLIMLDIMLPDEDGIEILKKLKSNAKTANIPVIMASAKGTEYDKITGLDLGADDYIAKPFDLLELISRVNAKARRYINSNRLIKVKDITYNLTNDYFTKGNEALNLTSFEHKLLKLLILNKNKVISKKEIAKELYDDETKENIKSIIMIIKSLRNKIDSDDNSLIKSQYGVGYVINE